MKLYLVQHGLALPEEKDSRKPLSPEGKDTTQKVGKFLDTKGVKVECIWHSEKLRSIQTAQVLSECISYPRTEKRKDLNPSDPVDRFYTEFLKINKDFMIVGHLPFLQKLASLLLTGSEGLELVSFRYSAVLCLEYRDKWKISWFITPEMI
ncbi:MAG: phosphohistidine phosphatase SixA [Candidatus Omnitrophota bacterium]